MRCGYTPREFWRMAPFELRLAVKARGLEREDDLEFSAIHAAWVMAPHLKEPLSADDLMGRPKIDLTRFSSIGEALAHVRQAQGGEP